jgi:hypothetical protein
MEQPAKPNGNGLTAALNTLAKSGDKMIQFGTLGLIACSGLGNWVATWNSANQNKQEIEVNRRVAWEGEQRIREDVRRQVDEMHRWIKESSEEFHKGNADSAANRKMLTRLQDEVEELKRIEDQEHKNN